ncbi:hypothetical protein MROS_2318 [Melioribacter roseus P3M-2]|uniref:Alginate lyase domain-containing protein n=1 Tax=Melioribacter roseus (strain DSM 23840 / JCM 17771 / VKM B-2668 / P3M-2) TaxID=1191523 RepID=I7A2W6_MELRP|nr:alginate lyase family protein [Melioribacter roseus]AFN75548.1 hypothetical protein MROS_2318 [Melioribacter roseus P3M-2]
MNNRTIFLIAFIYCLFAAYYMFAKDKIISEIIAIEKQRIIPIAERYLLEIPITITAFHCERSAGGTHDFYSEGDYWWPDPDNPDAPYIQRDGMTNPQNITAHRKVLIRFSLHVATLTSAYKLTNDIKYAQKAIEHLLAWFVNPDTKMNPNLLYAQAIKGRVTGRGIGIIDTIHLIEISQSIMILEKAGILKGNDLNAIKKWFRDYLEWLTTHQYGIDEMNAKNNHGTCWVMQAAVYAKLVGDSSKIEFCRKRFKEVLLPNQMDKDGSFPLELARTKPYNYSLFNLDAMTTICQILSTNQDNLWNFTLPDGRGIKKAIDFMYPYILDKSKWPYRHDVMYFDEYPVRQPSLLFGGLAYNEYKYIDLWKTLKADPSNEEVIRNLPIRHPILWINTD